MTGALRVNHWHTTQVIIFFIKIQIQKIQNDFLRILIVTSPTKKTLDVAIDIFFLKHSCLGAIDQSVERP